MSKHTPGPWKAEGWESVVVNDTNGNTLVLMPGASYGLAAVKANARLIAAAPDLLAACKAVDDAWTGGENGDWRGALDRALGMARAAIAKAEGGAK